MPRVADWNLPAPAGSGSERRSLPMAQGRSEGSRSPMLAGIHTVSLLRVRSVSSRFRCFGGGRFVTVSSASRATSRFRHGFVASGAGLKRANRNQGVQCRLEEIRTHWQQPMARGTGSSPWHEGGFVTVSSRTRTGSSPWHEGVRSGRVGVLAPRVHLLPQPARASTDVAARAQAQIDRHSAWIDADGGEVAREVLREHLERAMGEPCSACGARVQLRWSLSRKPKEVGAVQVFAVQGAHCGRIFTLGRGWYCEVGHWAGGDHARVLEDGMHERALDRTRSVPVGRGRRRGEHLPARPGPC